MIYRRLFYSLFILISTVAVCKSAPLVNNTSGTFSKGTIVNISGTGFSARQDYSPATASTLARAWNDFENGNVVVDDWRHAFSGAYSENWSAVTGAQNRLGSSYYGARRYVNDTRGALEIAQLFDADEWYTSLWVQISDTCPVSGQQGKMIRIYGDNGNIYFAPYGSRNAIFSFFESIGGSQWGSPDGIGTNNWHRLEIHMKQSTTTTKVYLDGKLQWTRTDWPASNFNGGNHSWDIGNMVEAVRNTCYHRYDDIYLDHTIARVEICDSNTWTTDQSRHCEIQIPKTWSQSQITIAANSGSFSAGDTAYLYVIDSSGGVNSSGYPITIGSSGAIAPPAPQLNSISPK